MANYTPSLEAFKINGVSPFWSPADAADEHMAQAHALLTLLAGAHGVCDQIDTDSADPFDNIRHGITARALDGIASLVAIAQYQTDVATARHGAKQDDPEWQSLVSTFEAAKSELDEWNKVKDNSVCGSHENREHEARTAALCDVFDTAVSRLILTNAPDAEALRYKLQILALPTFTEMHFSEAGEYAKQVAYDA